MLRLPHWTWRALLVGALAVGWLAMMAPPADAQQMEDVVYLKDGSIIRGTIVEQRPGESILIRTRDGNQFRYTMDQVDRITKEPVAGSRGGSAGVQGKKSPGLAFLFSFLITGGGQVYNGQYAKGGIMFAAAVAGWSMYFATEYDCWEWDESCGVTYAGIGLVLGAALWSWIDAPMSASAINRKIDAGQYGLELGPRIDLARRRSVMAPSMPVPAAGPELRLSLARFSF